MELRSEEIDTIFGRGADSSDLAQQSLYKPAASATGEVTRITVDGRSAVAKVLGPPPPGDTGSWAAGTEPTDPYYWRREADIYASGLLDDPPVGIRAPRCLGVFDRDDGSVIIWLEDLQAGTLATQFDIAAHAQSIRRLGRWQARLTNVALPQELEDSGWMSTYVDRHAGDVDLLSDTAVVGGLRALVDPVLAERVLCIWNERELFLDWALTGPQTFAHHDLSPKNLFRLHHDIVVIDWAFATRDALGVDAGAYGINAAADFHLDPTQVAVANDQFATSFLDGLNDEGWADDATIVRRSLAASAAIKFAWLLPAVCRGSISDWATFNGKPRLDGIACWARLVPEVLRQADIARSLG